MCKLSSLCHFIFTHTLLLHDKAALGNITQPGGFEEGFSVSATFEETSSSLSTSFDVHGQPSHPPTNTSTPSAAAADDDDDDPKNKSKNTETDNNNRGSRRGSEFAVPKKPARPTATSSGKIKLQDD